MTIETKGLWDSRNGLLAREVYTDQAIYQQELERVFGRAWLFIGHDSLIPDPNDFFLTYMGEDPVILTRDAKGEVHAFLNMCRHRGNRVARADDGNAKNFMCTYHGWTYSNEGKLVSVPGLQEAYYGELDVDKLGLVSVAQIDTYAGLIFATWDPQAPSLEDYLGDMRWYLDAWFNRRKGGVELIGPFKWIGEFNWKIASDNFAGDGYHIPVTHQSANIARSRAAGQKPPEPSRTFSSRSSYYSCPGYGHGIANRFFATEEEFIEAASVQQRDPLLRDYFHEISPEMEERLGTVRAKRLNPIVGTVFPTMSFLHMNGTVRVWHPRGPLTTEVWAFVAIDKAAPQEVKNAVRVQSMRVFGPSGIFEQDDMDNWRQVTYSGKSIIGRRTRLHVAMGLGHQVGHHDALPGYIDHAPVSEQPQRGFTEGWQAFMEAESWKEIPANSRTATYKGTATFKG